MTEQFVSNSEKFPNVLVERVHHVREKINEHRAFRLLDDIYLFDKELKKDVIALFGSTRLLQQVAAWQMLVGGTIEPEENITPDQKTFVEEKIETFITDLESKLK